MNKATYTQEFLSQHLSSNAELASFYVYYPDSVESGLIHYFDCDGASWSLMEDDHTLVSACLEFLNRAGTPFFDSMGELIKYEAERKAVHFRKRSTVVFAPTNTWSAKTCTPRRKS